MYNYKVGLKCTIKNSSRLDKSNELNGDGSSDVKGEEIERRGSADEIRDDIVGEVKKRAGRLVLVHISFLARGGRPLSCWNFIV